VADDLRIGAIRATSSASGTRFRVAPWGLVNRADLTHSETA
jgi:hypothetical protein